jgi:hypothetical protein
VNNGEQAKGAFAPHQNAAGFLRTYFNRLGPQPDWMYVGLTHHGFSAQDKKRVLFGSHCIYHKRWRIFGRCNYQKRAQRHLEATTALNHPQLWLIFCLSLILQKNS